MFGGLGPLIFGKEARHILIYQPFLHFGHGENVAIADNQIDVIEAIVDHFLVEAAGMLFARDPFFGDGESDSAIAKQASTHIVIIGVQAEDVAV